MRRLLLAILALPVFAFSQSTQVGGFIAGGGSFRLFETSAHHFVAGAEACLLCGGRLGLFLEYQHWAKLGVGTDRPLSMDLASAGLRIQGKGARVRPFFDIGVIGGGERVDYYYPFNLETHAVGGGVIGFGAAVSLGERWYIRPMAKIVVLSSAEVGGFAGASLGYRF